MRTVCCGTGMHERLQIETIVDALHAPRGLRKARAEVTGGVIAHRHDETGVMREARTARDAFILLAEDVIGVGGEAVAQAIKFPEPPARTRADTGEMRVRMTHARRQLPQAVADPRGFIDAIFVRALAPLTQREHNALGEEVRVLPLEHLFNEQIFGRQEMDTLRQAG